MNDANEESMLVDDEDGNLLYTLREEHDGIEWEWEASSLAWTIRPWRNT